jgi:hypothetical protein
VKAVIKQHYTQKKSVKNELRDAYRGIGVIKEIDTPEKHVPLQLGVVHEIDKWGDTENVF